MWYHFASTEHSLKTGQWFALQSLPPWSALRDRAHPNSALRALRAAPGSAALVSRHTMETPRFRSSERN